MYDADVMSMHSMTIQIPVQRNNFFISKVFFSCCFKQVKIDSDNLFKAFIEGFINFMHEKTTGINYLII